MSKIDLDNSETYYFGNFEDQFKIILKYCIEQIKEKENVRDFQTALIQEVYNFQFEDDEEVIGILHEDICFKNKEILKEYNNLRETEEGKEYTFTECVGLAIKKHIEKEIIVNEIGEEIKNYYESEEQ